MVHSPTVSVIIPTYNRASLLREAIDSVLAQTVPAHEVVVVDDGSSDSTLELLARYNSQTKQIKVVSVEHTPLVGRVRNAGVAASSGSVLAFLDSDDVWKPTRIERQLAFWRQNSVASLAFCNLESFDERGARPARPYLRQDARYGPRILTDLLLEPIIVPSTMMVTREAFDCVGPFSDGVIEEDYEFLLDAAACFEAIYAPEVLVEMRDHGGTRARSRAELANLEYLRIVRRFLQKHPELLPEEKATARHGLANVHLKLARSYTEAGSRVEARKHLAAAAKLRPLDRRLPGALARVVLGRRV